MGSICCMDNPDRNNQNNEINKVNELLTLLENEELELMNLLFPKNKTNEDSLIHHKLFTLITVNSALTELMYIGQLYESELVENIDEFKRYKELFTYYYKTKEANWKESSAEIFCTKVKEYGETKKILNTV